MSTIINTAKILPFLLVMLFFPNCSNQMKFEDIRNDWIVESTKSIQSYDDVKNEIAVFSEKPDVKPEKPPLPFPEPLSFPNEMAVFF